MFWLTSAVGAVAMAGGFASQQWLIAVLGALVAMQAINGDLCKHAAMKISYELQELKGELRETAQLAPKTTVQFFWARYQYEQDQKKPGSPPGPLGGVG